MIISTSDMFQITDKVLYGCKIVLDGRLHDCKLAIHAKCFDEHTKINDSVRNVRNRRNENISIGTIMILQDEQRICCHHSLKDLQVHADGKWGD